MAGLTIEEMKKIKKEIKFTNAKLAMVSGVPLGTVNKILSGDTKNPGHKTMDALERALLGADYKRPDETKANMVQETAIYGVKKEEHKQGSYTIEDYYALPDNRRVELIDGAFYDLAAPTIRHQEICGEVYYHISAYIRLKKGTCKVFYAPIDVKLDGDNKTMVQPDIVIVCDPDKIKEGGIEGAPDFVLEVLSPSTKRKDRYLKAGKYMAAGVKEYWMIDPKLEKVMICNFADEDAEETTIMGFEGLAEVNLYGGDLKIDLSKLRR